MTLPLEIFTLVLDGQPWISKHLPVFDSLPFPWRWHIVEGAANNVNCTAWCQKQSPRLSSDGTSEYLDSIKDHPCVTINRAKWWDGGKLQMCNSPLHLISKPCVLLQVDSDELWTAQQLETLVRMFTVNAQMARAYFFCQFHVGPDIVTIGENGYGNHSGEWLRAWRYVPGMRFGRHEPPVLNGNKGAAAPREFTRNEGLVFTHMAYATEKAVRYKMEFYGYKDAVLHWKRLQSNTVWPVRRLKDFLPWVTEGTGAMRLTEDASISCHSQCS